MQKLPSSRDGVSRMLARLLDRPDAIEAVRALPGERFRDLVATVGLEDAGEILALASRDQLVLAFDDDLFRAAAAGEDEGFDAARFLVWLEVLRESGDDAAAERLASLSEDFLALVVARSAFVLDQDGLAGLLAEDPDAEERFERLVAAAPTEEIDRYLLVAREREGWDALVAVLVTMDRDDHALVARVLERVVGPSERALLDDGIEERIDTIEEDAAAERDDRRAARGYVAPADARAFLAAAREGRGDPALRDPTTRAVLRDQAHARGEPIARASRPFVVPRVETAALAVAERRTVRAAMAALLSLSHEDYTRRADELAYLVNVVVAGASIEGRAPRPVEAYEHVVATIELALDADPGLSLEATPADVVYRRGRHLLQRTLVAPSARIALGIARGKGAASLAEALDRDRPWIARRTFLDTVDRANDTAAERLADLFDACPHVEGRFFGATREVERALAAVARRSKKLPRSSGR